MKSPQEITSRIQASPEAPSRAVSGEAYSGFAVLGVSFASGHTLALRDFPRATTGRPFTSVWMREPNGDWHFFSTVSPSGSCAKYMRPAVADQTAIEVAWLDRRTLRVEIPAIGLRWIVALEARGRFGLMSRVAGMLPAGLKRTRPGAKALATIASRTLGAGKFNLSGRVPNGQPFIAQPSAVWRVTSSQASIRGFSFGDVVRAPEQYRFGDFRLPTRGVAMAGTAVFEPVPEAEEVLYPFGATA